MKKMIIFLCIFIYSAVFADINLWLSTATVDANTQDLSLWAQSTSGDLTQIDAAQWGIAYVLDENTPSTTLQYNLFSDWGNTTTVMSISVGSYDRILEYSSFGAVHTISTTATLLATIRFTKGASGWGSVHIVTSSDNETWGTFITNGGSFQTIHFPSSDQSLPVLMQSITASYVATQGVEIEWTTASEWNSLGFYVYRSADPNGSYEKLTVTMIPNQGNTSSGSDYSYIDSEAKEGVAYWYKIEEVNSDGGSTFFGPIYVHDTSAKPHSFELSQNFPNPFNNGTVIRYQLPEDAFVNLSVYDILGQKVRTLVNETQPTNYYEITWNGKGDKNRVLPSGVYFMRLQTETFVQVRRVLMLQ